MSTYRFGKNPPKHDYRTLRFQDYLSATLPPPPPSHDVLGSVYANLKIADPAVLFPMDGNDWLGDCTVAAAAHASTMYHGLVGRRSVLAPEAVVKLYLHLTGGIDSGLSALDVLNYWRKHPVSGEAILAFASINPRNHLHVKQAIALFGGAYLGFQVPQDCVAQFRARIPWTAGPLTPNGHAVFAVGYTSSALTVLSWGNVQQATWQWWDECVDEAYAIVPAEAADAGFAPGFSSADLIADLAAVAS